ARLTRLGDRLARAAAVAAGTGDGEEPLLIAQLAGAAALAARLGRRALGCTRALARRAGFLAWNLDGGLGAGRRLLEADLEVVAEIRTSLRSTAAAAAAEHVAEPEHVAKSGEDVRKI